MATKTEKTWTVTVIDGEHSLDPEDTTIQVGDKANALKVARVFRNYGLTAYVYINERLPQFDSAGNLK